MDGNTTGTMGGKPCIHTGNCHHFRPMDSGIGNGATANSIGTEDSKTLPPPGGAGFIFFAVDEEGCIRIERGGNLDSVLQALGDYVREVKRKIW